MQDSERFKLLKGPYAAPRCEVRGFLRCRMRGKVRVTSISDAPIPWPCTRNGSPILCGDLVKAVRRESAEAVAHWFGVSAQTVCIWRNAVGVEQNNAGTIKLRRRLAPETCQSEQCKAKLTLALKSPERAAKIAAAKRGVPRPEHVRESIGESNTGKRPSKKSRKKMSESQKARVFLVFDAFAASLFFAAGLVGLQVGVDRNVVDLETVDALQLSCRGRPRIETRKTKAAEQNTAALHKKNKQKQKRQKSHADRPLYTYTLTSPMLHQ